MTNTTDIRPFRVEVPEAELEDLRARLARTRFTAALPGPAWQRGVPVDYVRELAEYWRTGYDWRATEARLNALPQFTTEIDGQKLYFQHVRSPEPGARPLLLLHGWPGSVLEFEGMIGPLTDPAVHGGDAADAFHVIIPALPGFGFTGTQAGEGWDSGRIARAFDTLMSRLGYDRYLVHGGDAGAMIGRQLAILAPERVEGLHVLQAFSFPSGDPQEMAGLGPEDFARLGILSAFRDRAGYMEIHGTRPQTLGFALADSPVGLLAWNLELPTGWGEYDPLTRDQILDEVTLYWLTGTAGSAANWYYEDRHAEAKPTVNQVPTAVAVFEHDFKSIRVFAERDNARLVHWSEFDHGGHFAALEVPGELAQDIRAFARAASQGA
jgi:epoxide hydrolase